LPNTKKEEQPIITYEVLLAAKKLVEQSNGDFKAALEALKKAA
jgi:hypothetical protein